jgi:hypothetical protein
MEGENLQELVQKLPGIIREQEARLIAKRMREWEEEYFRFIEAGIEATNNPAELTIRQSILDRIAGEPWGNGERVA